MERDGFQWGRQHRAYIARCHAACRLSVHELAVRCGYRNIAKFQRRRRVWSGGRTGGRGRIPVVFLAAIRVDLCTLTQAVEADRALYARALASLSRPAHVVSKGMAGVGVRHALPEGLQGEELYPFVQELVDAGRLVGGQGMLCWPGLKTVFFQRGKAPSEHTREPQFVVHGGQVHFGAPPAEVLP